MNTDLEPVTKGDLKLFKKELKEELKEELTKELTTVLFAEMARIANATMEHMTALFRVADDRATAVADRVTAVETRLDDHVADAALHRAPRRSRRR